MLVTTKCASTVEASAHRGFAECRGDVLPVYRCYVDEFQYFRVSHLDCSRHSTSRTAPPTSHPIAPLTFVQK